MDVTARLDWSGADASPAQPVNSVLVQGVGEELILSFGHAAPPVAMATMTNEKVVDYLKENPVLVHHVARFTLPLGTARTLLEGLQKALGTHDAATKKSDAPAGADAQVAS